MIKLFMSGHTACNGDGPSAAYYEADQAFFERLTAAMDLLATHDYTEIRFSDGPQWEDEVDYRLDGHEAVVIAGSFWFTAFTKLGDHRVETELVELDALRNALDLGTDLFIGLDPTDAAEYFPAV